MSAHVVTPLAFDVAGKLWGTVIEGAIGGLIGAILLLVVCVFAMRDRDSRDSSQATQQARVPTMQSSPSRDANATRGGPVEPDPVLKNFSANEIKRLTELRRRYQAGDCRPALHHYRFIWWLVEFARTIGRHER